MLDWEGKSVGRKSMIKSISLAYRKPGMNREEFSKYWVEKHGPMAAKMFPGLRKYVQNHFLAIPGREVEGDGVVEMWWDDVEAFENSMKFLNTPEGRPLAQDGEKFSVMKGSGPWVVVEHVIKDEVTKK
jgi:uncharacterized protein (TIGR02118 family)